MARSAARSLATCSRADALLTLPPRVSFSDGSSRWTTRMRSGAATGASCEPRRLVGVRGPDPAVDDALVPELRAAEQRVVGVDEALVAAPVDLERRALVGPVGRFEVGVDVGAAEGVDRLLRVADEDERRVAVPEGAAHDVPLDGVGVLELVDEHDAVALSEALGRGLAAGALERVVEAGEQVVVGHDRHLALAAFELVADGERQAAAHRLDGVPRRVLGLDAHRGVVDRDPRDPHRLRAVELRARRCRASAARRGRRRRPRAGR